MAIALAAQRAALRTARGPLRPLWAAVYALSARVSAVYLRAGRSSGTVYLRGSLADGEPLYGSADIDLAIVVPAEPGRTGAARRRTHERWGALVRRLPPLKKFVQLKVYEGDELQRAAGETMFTEPREDRLSGDEVGLRVRPGLGSPTTGWRRIAGPERRAAGPATAPQPHLAAWLELQWWWRLCFAGCLHPLRSHVPYLCLKLITQSARVRLWLEQGEIVAGHTEVLARARATMPEEEEALRGAERLWRELPRSPDPPLAEALGFLLRATARVAERLTGEAHAQGGTAVRLLGAETEAADLALGADAAAQLTQLESELRTRQVVPLADWRARTPQPLFRDGRVDPPLADEALAIVGRDAGSPAELSHLARLSASGLRPGLRWGPLLLLPSSSYFAWLQRSVQFEHSDPVSYALLAGERHATFPELTGWSASDCARRAVDAHAFWLQRFGATDETETGTALGLLLGAARAALLSESLERAEPELAVTAAAVASRLAEDQPGSATVLEEALGSYRAWRGGGPVPQGDSVIALRRLVERLPVYALHGSGQVPSSLSVPRGASGR